MSRKSGYNTPLETGNWSHICNSQRSSRLCAASCAGVIRSLDCFALMISWSSWSSICFSLMLAETYEDSCNVAMVIVLIVLPRVAALQPGKHSDVTDLAGG